MKQFRVVGKPLPRLDGVDGVTGRATYTVDVAPPGLLHARLFRSSFPHAKIRRIDVSRALALPGVAAILTAAEAPSKRFGFGIQDEELFARDKARYVGDVIAAVAAVNEATADQALELIECDYETLPAALTVNEALRENAPLVHENLDSYHLNTVLARDWHPVYGTNIAHQTSFSKGDIDRGFAEADEIFDDTFRSQQVQQCSLEPHAVVAEWNGDRLTLWTSTQKVFLVRSGLADLFDLSEDKIRVIGSKVGAGFGGKNAMRLEPYAAALALKTGKPVRLVNSRAEEFFAAAGSVPAIVRVKTGVKKDGTITARAMEFTWDTGAYAEGLAGSNRALKDGVGPYKVPNIRVSSTLVYTNKLRGCPFRGLGIPEAVWAGESQMDMIAQKLGIDSVELRLKNCLDTGDETPAGDRANHIALRDCLLKVSEELKRWKKRAPADRGFDIALLHKSPTTSASSSNARVRIAADERIELFIGATDVGGGTGTSLGQIVAEELDVPLSAVRVVIADTELTPFDHGTYSSRVTPYVGGAVKLAATAPTDRGEGGPPLESTDRADSVRQRQSRRRRPTGVSIDRGFGAIANRGNRRRRRQSKQAALGRRCIEASTRHECAGLAVRCPGSRGGGGSRNRRDQTRSRRLGTRCRQSDQPAGGHWSDRGWYPDGPRLCAVRRIAVR